jgi:hypothetical protein
MPFQRQKKTKTSLLLSFQHLQSVAALFSFPILTYCTLTFKLFFPLGCTGTQHYLVRELENICKYSFFSWLFFLKWNASRSYNSTYIKKHCIHCSKKLEKLTHRLSMLDSFSLRQYFSWFLDLRRIRIWHEALSSNPSLTKNKTEQKK